MHILARNLGTKWKKKIPILSFCLKSKEQLSSKNVLQIITLVIILRSLFIVISSSCLSISCILTYPGGDNLGQQQQQTFLISYIIINKTFLNKCYKICLFDEVPKIRLVPETWAWESRVTNDYLPSQTSNWGHEWCHQNFLR